MLDKAALFREIDEYFFQQERLERVRVFTRRQRQVEGWFKGELLYLFDSLRKAQQISDWAAEIRLAADRRQRCDFKVAVADGPVYLEVKTLYHGLQQGQPIDLGLYFLKTPDGVGITDDVVKLLRVSNAYRYALLFVYPRPDASQWGQLMETYQRRIAPIAVTEHSKVGDYPPELYICKLAVEGGF